MYKQKILDQISVNGPISAQEILKNLQKKSPNINKTTVYRQLEKLAKEGTVTELFLGNDYKSYEISSNHHHIICTKCKKVECLPEDCQVNNPKTTFKVTSHNLEFYGLCPTCQTQ